MPTNGEWYVEADGFRDGPLTDEQFAELIQAHHLRPTDRVRGPGFSEWKLADEILNLLAHGNASPADASASHSGPNIIVEANSTPAPVTSQPRTSRRSYFTRHWRGELSLGRLAIG